LWTSAIAQTPYPPALDYGISQHLARAPAACLKLPIDGGSRPHTHDKGAENQPRQQQAIDAVQQIVGLGLMESVPSNIPGYREYRITDVAAYDGRGSFCYGREVLTRIISIGPPRSLGPICVREAEVLTEFRDIPAWMDRPSLAPYVENRAAWKSARSKTIELQRDGKRWTASERYDPIHSNWLGPRSFDACKAHR
jgi:hypothetical protein